ncbi:MAG: peroxiredoxin family protein [Verrucomicrobia bacterium]|nr:peroxiredoxin family protein [Verrucomicrobiota bacterium]
MLFAYYVFGLSYQMPKPTPVAEGLSATPEFEVQDQDGRLVRLSDFRGRRLVLTFYRGHW